MDTLSLAAYFGIVSWPILAVTLRCRRLDLRIYGGIEGSALKLRPNTGRKLAIILSILTGKSRDGGLSGT